MCANYTLLQLLYIRWLLLLAVHSSSIFMFSILGVEIVQLFKQVRHIYHLREKVLIHSLCYCFSTTSAVLDSELLDKVLLMYEAGLVVLPITANFSELVQFDGNIFRVNLLSFEFLPCSIWLSTTRLHPCVHLGQEKVHSFMCVSFIV